MATTDTQQTAQFAAQAAVSAAEAKQYLLSIEQPVIDISESVADAQNAAAAAEMARDQAQGISTSLVQTIDSQLSEQETQFESQMTTQQSSFESSQSERESSFEEKSNEFESRFSSQLSTQESTFSESQTDKENRFQQFLLSSGYVFLGGYENGPFQFSARNQYIRYDNEYYRLNAATDVGFTTTGTDATSFANDVTHFVLMDGDTLRQNLGSDEKGLGISLNALEQGGNGQHLAVFVSPQMRHADPHAHFGTAMMAAFSAAMSMGIGEVRVPAGVYTLDATVAVTLSMSMTLAFDPGVIIYVDSPLTAFNFDINGKHLSIEGNNARVLSRWGSLANTETVAFKFTDATLDKSLTVSNLKVGTADSTSKFQYSVYGTGLNLTTFTDCVLQSTYGIYLESVLLNGTLYHAMGNQIDKCKVYTDDYCVKVGNQGALGCEGFVITGGEFVTSTTAFIVDNTGLSSAAYLPPLFRFEGMHISAYRALYAKDISRLFFVGADVQVKSNPSITGIYNGVIELGGVQQFHHDKVSYSSVPLNGATGADMIPVIYQFASTLSNAFFTSNGNIYQLDAMTAPVFAFSGTANVTEIQVSNDRLTSSGSWVSSTYLAYVRLPPEMTIGNLGASAGLDYSTKGAFSSGVLSLGTRPSQGFTYTIPTSILPNGSAISQITFPSQMVGKEVNILLAAANVSFTHGANMICPDQKSFVMTLPNVIKVFALNTTQCVILDVGGMANRHTDITSIPTSRTSPGYPGAEYFDSSTMTLYRYIAGYGWGKVAITAIS
ncbi:hypothetical protein [Klebsiella variicola]|uniref:hypothetical protein n=1 Tax=Klebsiella variicola TaxID=244366 RepID=UPI0007CCC2AE|nr:hypothetical protein [Klebsiella variicola]SAU29136.1 Uncharacterised protein [Klebsiella variicola]